MENADLMLPEDLIVEETSDSFRSFSAGDEAFEIDVIRLKNKSESEAREILESRLEEKKNALFPCDLSRILQLQRAEIFRKGEYLVMLITSSNREVKKAFLDYYYR